MFYSMYQTYYYYYYYNNNNRDAIYIHFYNSVIILQQMEDVE